jgi:hypothetical protein
MVTITDKNSQYHGQQFWGYVCYYDIQHTGNGPDLFILETPEGKRHFLSTQIDVKDYWERERERHIKNLGANVGDRVRILKGGGGCFSADWKQEDVHTITHINTSGNVTFDNDAATIFRPVVERVE